MRRLAGTGAVLLVVLAAGAISLAAGAAFLDPPRLSSSAALAMTMGAIAGEDLRNLRVPDPLVLIAGAAGLAHVWLSAAVAGFDPLPPIADAALQSLACGGALFLLREVFFRLRGSDGLGLGDVKLALVGGFWLGWQLFALAVFLAAMAALLVAAIQLLLGRWQRGNVIPLAFYLAPAIWVSWFFAQLPAVGPDRMI